MRKYIFYVPEENEPIGDVYYPDERDDPMPVRPLVHCKDCIWSRPDMSDHECRLPLWCDRIDVDKYEDGFCDWGEAKGQSCS